MRVLVVHSRYRSKETSGENQVVESEAHLLREAGHDVLVWSPDPGVVNFSSNLHLGVRAIWSSDASARVRQMLRHQLDVVHIHNLFPMVSPAILRATDGTPAVMTLHNYRLLCLPATLTRNGKICEDCLGRAPWRGVVHRCYRDSVGASSALATALILHRTISTFDRVTLYLAVSEFVKAKHTEGGLPPDRIRVKPNFAWPTHRREGPGKYFLYLGRLSREKGALDLVSGWDVNLGDLVVAGDGPEVHDIKALTSDAIKYLGPVGRQVAGELLLGARALLYPSQCYEAAPRTILEAYAAGVPVLASDIGALREAVDHEQTGLLVDPKSQSAWREATERLLDDRESERQGDAAYKVWQERYSPKVAIRELEAAYAEAIALGS